MLSRMIEDLIVTLIYGFMVFLRWLFLTSRPGKFIHNLLYYAIGRLTANQIEHRRKYELLWGTLFGRNKGFEQWAENVYRSVNWQHYCKGTFIRRLMIGSLKRRYYGLRGKVVPSMIIVSPNAPKSGCNLKCLGCFSKDYPDEVLPLETFRKIMREQEELGIYCVMITGAEPFMYPFIWEILREFPKTTFWVTTNGTLLDSEKLQRIAKLGNISLFFGLAGPEKYTDYIRGQGTFAKVMETMKIAKELKMIFFTSVTLTRQNYEEATNDDFLQRLVGNGCFGISYASYMPIGSDPHPDWTVTDEQLDRLEELKYRVYEKYPLFITIGKNGSEKVWRCFAGGQYLHVLPNGTVEPCVFARWADPRYNVKINTILEITDSIFFQIVRKVTAWSKPGVTPCRAHLYPALIKGFEKCGALLGATQERR